jgi:hypothetical protein
VTANLNAKVVVIDEEFPEEILGHVSLGEQTTILRVGNCSDFGRDEEPLPSQANAMALHSSSIQRARRDCRRVSR